MLPATYCPYVRFPKFRVKGHGRPFTRITRAGFSVSFRLPSGFPGTSAGKGPPPGGPATRLGRKIEDARGGVFLCRGPVYLQQLVQNLGASTNATRYESDQRYSAYCVELVRCSLRCLKRLSYSPHLVQTATGLARSAWFIMNPPCSVL